MELNGVRKWDLAKKIGCGPMAVEFWMWNQVLPNLINARKIELATGGAVPMLSWLGTPYGQKLYAQHANWDKIAESGWREYNEKQDKKAAP